MTSLVEKSFSFVQSITEEEGNDNDNEEQL